MICFHALLYAVHMIFFLNCVLKCDFCLLAFITFSQCFYQCICFSIYIFNNIFSKHYLDGQFIFFCGNSGQISGQFIFSYFIIILIFLKNLFATFLKKDFFLFYLFNNFNLFVFIVLICLVNVIANPKVVLPSLNKFLLF